MIGAYDILLIAVVSLQATTLAYMYHPKWKAFMMTLPVPFTCAVLALGHRIDATNVAGMLVLLLFTHGVRILYYNLRVPIVVAIAISALGYCVAGWGIARVLPTNDLSFWLVSAGALAVAIALLLQHPHRDEPGHRTSLPIWVKLPIVMVVILFLVLIKNNLRGFMTMFPMVGVIGAYEARHCLWTISRQISVVILVMLPMMVVSRLTYPRFGLGVSLALGWIAFLCVFVPLTRAMWNSQRGMETE